MTKQFDINKPAKTVSRWTTKSQDAQFYMVFVCGVSMAAAESLIHNTFDLELVLMWERLGAAASDDGFEALTRWAKAPKPCTALSVITFRRLFY